MHLYFDSGKTAVDIKKSKQLLGDELTQPILATHTFCSCDTIPRLRSVGSCTVLQKCLKNLEFRNLLRIFSLTSSDREDIFQAGVKIPLLLLGGIRENLLTSFLYLNNMEKCQDRLNTPSKLKVLNLLQTLYSSICFVYIMRYSWRENSPPSAR